LNKMSAAGLECKFHDCLFCHAAPNIIHVNVE
jgi:hypothetical protein